MILVGDPKQHTSVEAGDAFRAMMKYGNLRVCRLQEIQRQKEKGIQEMKDTVAALSVQIASRVIEKELNEATHRQLVDSLIKDLSKVQRA